MGEANDDFEIPFITVKRSNNEGDQKFKSVKPLYKLKIKDLLEIPIDEENDQFTFRNKQISLVMFGGKIENIFRDDSIFSFKVNDGTGSIQCFFKVKEDPEILIDRIKNGLNSLSEMPNITHCQEITMFNHTANDTILNNYDKESEEMMKEIFYWFKNEVLTARKIKDIDDIIHVSGHLIESDSVRKVNVVDYRIVENLEEHQDFQLELNYLYKRVYDIL